MPRFAAHLLLIGACGLAQGPALTVKAGVEDGKRMLVAQLLDGAKPVPNATVAFAVKRSFGSLPLGQDTTLDDGTAAVPLPPTLPPDPDGSYRVELEVVSPAEFTSVAAHLSLSSGSRASGNQPRQSRELWSRRAPVSLIAALVLVLAAVWGTYAAAVRQLFHIKQGGSHA